MQLLEYVQCRTRKTMEFKRFEYLIDSRGLTGTANWACKGFVWGCTAIVAQTVA
jgi:hypothetical protein